MATPAPVSQTLVNNALLSATLQDRSKGYVEQVGNHIPLFYWLKKEGRYKPATGNRIEVAVEYGLDTAEPSYQGLEPWNLQETDNVTIIQANWKQYGKSIVISGIDKVKANKAAIFNLLEQKEANALTSLQNQMNQHFYLDGTGNSSKRITGLAAMIAEAPTTGTYLGINRATAGNEWWRNQSKDTNGAHFTASGSVPTIVMDMEALKIQCGRLAVGGMQHRYPDLILCTETYFLYYNNAILRSGVRFVNQKVRDAGFDNLTFGGATMIHDVDCPADAGTDQKAFFINSRFVQLRHSAMSDYNFGVGDYQEASDQDGFSAKIKWAGELICTNCAKQGIHQGLQAAA